MPAKAEFTKVGFIKSYLLPALFTFLIPGFSLWFFRHVESYYDQHMREAIVSQIKADKELTDEKRETAIKFYQRVPVSRILASNKPEAKPLQDGFNHVKTRYAIFRWMKRSALACLATAVGVSVVVGIGVLLSFRSQSAQY